MAEMTALRAHRRGGPEVMVMDVTDTGARPGGSPHRGSRRRGHVRHCPGRKRGNATAPTRADNTFTRGLRRYRRNTTTSPNSQTWPVMRFTDSSVSTATAPPPSTSPHPPPTSPPVASVSHIVAAALPLAGLTASQGLVDTPLFNLADFLVHGGPAVSARSHAARRHPRSDGTTTVRSDAARDFASTLAPTTSSTPAFSRSTDLTPATTSSSTPWAADP